MRRFEWPPSRAEIEFTTRRGCSRVRRNAPRSSISSRIRAGAIGDDRAHDRFVAKPGAGVERVAYVQFEGILAARHAGDAALRPGGIRFAARGLCHHRHLPVTGGFQREAESGDTTADDQKIKSLHEFI